MNLLGPSHVEAFLTAGVALTIKQLSEPFMSAAGSGSECSTATESVCVHRLSLNVKAGHIAFEDIELYLVPNATEIILGMPFTEKSGSTSPSTLRTTQ